MISSRIKVQYWMNDSMVSPSDNLLLYPGGTDVVSQIHIFDADWTDGLLDGLDAAWNFATGVLSVAEGHLLSAGFSELDFRRSITSLKDHLSDKVGTKAATLAIAYPHELFNTIHVVFEADAGCDLRRPAASPPTNPPLVQYHDSKAVGKHQWAEYIINLHQFREQMGDERFYGSAGSLYGCPGLAFAFADVEDDTDATLSVLQTLSISFHHRAQLPLTVATDAYYLRGPDSLERSNLVQVQRLMQYTPAMELTTPGSDDAWQAVQISLERFGDGSYRTNGKPYERIMLWFHAVSLRGYKPDRPKIEIIGEGKPEDLDILRPQLWQPVPFLGMDRSGQMYQAEGCGSAVTRPFSPADVPAGTHKIYFIAYQDSNWSSAQVVNLAPAFVESGSRK